MQRNVTAAARFRDLYATCSCSFAITSHLGNSSSSSWNSSSIGTAIDGSLLPITTFTRIRYYELRFEICSAIFEAADVRWLVRSFVCLFRVGCYFYNQHIAPCFNNMCLVPPIFLCIFVLLSISIFHLLWLPLSLALAFILRIAVCMFSQWI